MESFLFGVFIAAFVFFYGMLAARLLDTLESRFGMRTGILLYLSILGGITASMIHLG